MIKEIILLDFYADWCGPCKTLMKILDSVNSEGLTIKKINVEEEEPFAREMKITGLPTVVLMSNGVEVDRFSGVRTKEEIEALIKKHQ